MLSTLSSGQVSSRVFFLSSVWSSHSAANHKVLLKLFIFVFLSLALRLLLLTLLTPSVSVLPLKISAAMSQVLVLWWSLSVDTSIVYSGQSLPHHSNTHTHTLHACKYYILALCVSIIMTPTVVLRQAALQSNKGAFQPIRADFHQYRGNFSMSPRQQLRQTPTNRGTQLSLQLLVDLTDRHLMKETSLRSCF